MLRTSRAQSLQTDKLQIPGCAAAAVVAGGWQKVTGLIAAKSRKKGRKVSPILLGHEPLGEIIFLLAESEFETLGNSAGFRWLDLSRFQNRKDFRRAH